MTNAYHKDLTAIDAIITALPFGMPAPAAAMLALLKGLLTAVRTNAQDLVTKVADTKAKYDLAFPDDLAAMKQDTHRRLNGLKAARKGEHKSRLELVMSFAEDGGNGSDPNNHKFIKALRTALDREEAAPHHTAKANLAVSALATGDSVHTFCDGLRAPDPSVAGRWLLASAIDLLLPLAKANGLWPEHEQTLMTLRENIRKAGGGGEGSSLWPSNYVSSSSSSSSGG